MPCLCQVAVQVGGGQAGEVARESQRHEQPGMGVGGLGRLVVDHPGAGQLVAPGGQAQPRRHAVVELRPAAELCRAGCEGRDA